MLAGSVVSLSAVDCLVPRSNSGTRVAHVSVDLAVAATRQVSHQGVQGADDTLHTRSSINGEPVCGEARGLRR